MAMRSSVEWDEKAAENRDMTCLYNMQRFLIEIVYKSS